MYGLSDASLKWYTRVKKIVTDSSGVIYKIDPSLFIWCSTKQEAVGLIEIHVDDFICNDFTESLYQNFKITSLLVKWRQDVLNIRKIMLII